MHSTCTVDVTVGDASAESEAILIEHEVRMRTLHLHTKIFIGHQLCTAHAQLMPQWEMRAPSRRRFLSSMR
jgi:hypothetical protein